jgi:regulator of sigma D
MKLAAKNPQRSNAFCSATADYLAGGHFMQEDDPQSFAKLIITSCKYRHG